VTHALLVAVLALAVVSCAPTPNPTEELRARAEAFALARTEARFEAAYGFTSPSFREDCVFDRWHIGLIREAGFMRAFNSLNDDAPLTWTVQLVEARGSEGTVVIRVASRNRGLEVVTRSWSFIDGTWWFDDPPDELCL
jgi:hypothetical protein